MSKIKEHNSGIYVIEIEGCEKFYIGSSNNLYFRKNEHFRKLKQNKHPNQHFQRAFNKYGEDSFKFSIIAICENNREYLLLLEQKVINSYNFDELFNICKIAGSPPLGPSLNRRFSSEDIKEIFNLYISGKSNRGISKIYKCDKSIIGDIISRETYADVLIDKEIVLLAQNKAKINTNKPCNEEEIQFIKDNYLKMGKTELSKIMKRGTSSISNMAKKLGLTRTSVWTNGDDEFIIQNYKLLSKKECADKLGKSVKKLVSRVSVLRNRGIDLKLNKENKARKKIWTKERIEFIKLNANKGSIFLADYFKVNCCSVLTICCRHKIKLGKG